MSKSCSIQWIKVKTSTSNFLKIVRGLHVSGVLRDRVLNLQKKCRALRCQNVIFLLVIEVSIREAKLKEKTGYWMKKDKSVQMNLILYSRRKIFTVTTSQMMKKIINIMNTKSISETFQI